MSKHGTNGYMIVFEDGGAQLDEEKVVGPPSLLESGQKWRKQIVAGKYEYEIK